MIYLSGHESYIKAMCSSLEMNINIPNSYEIEQIDFIKTRKIWQTKFPNSEIINIGNYEIFISDEFWSYSHSIFININKVNLLNDIYDCIVYKSPNIKPKIKLVTRNQSKFCDYTIDIKESDSFYYNDDVPIDKINSIINDKSSSILIFHGSPGTGKSYFIRNLVKNNPKLEFLYMDSKTLVNVESYEFIEYLSSYKNSIIILEDCESLLVSRDSEHNNILSTLLNLSDGIIGDAFNLKFICTFNTNLQNIDRAVFRKGRLKLKYEFKELSKDKVEQIFIKKGIDPSLAKPMTAAEAWNFKEDNGINTNKKKIGF